MDSSDVTQVKENYDNAKHETKHLFESVFERKETAKVPKQADCITIQVEGTNEHLAGMFKGLENANDDDKGSLEVISIDHTKGDRM